MKILALDYDGVIVDSKEETFISAYNIFLKLNNKNNLLSVKEFIKNREKYKEKIEEFTRLRTYINYAGNFIAAIDAVMNNIKIKDEKDFIAFADKRKYKVLQFREMFHGERERLQNEDLEAWFSLNKPFKIVNDLKKIKNKIVIVTGNKKELIKKQLDKIDFNIDSDDIYDSYLHENKIGSIQEVIKKYNIKKEDIVFVDDVYRFLLQVKDFGIKCYMATWGYSGPHQRKKAEKEGITLLTQDNFYEIINEELN